MKQEARSQLDVKTGSFSEMINSWGQKYVIDVFLRVDVDTKCAIEYGVHC